MVLRRSPKEGNKRVSLRSRIPERLRARKLKTPTIASLIPNITTILAMCCGLTAIRMAMLQRFDAAVIAVLLAAILDGMDGRLARLLGSTSRIGAELDSFSDLLSFGAAPAIVIYLKSLHQWGEMGWGIALYFTACMALRLARFNVRSREDIAPTWAKGYFTGAPAPAGGYMALWPIMVEHALNLGTMHPVIYGCTLIVTGALMVSRIPTFSMKNVSIHPKWVLPILLCTVLTLAVVYSYPWVCMALVGIGYLSLIPFSVKSHSKARKNNIEEGPQAA